MMKNHMKLSSNHQYYEACICPFRTIFPHHHLPQILVWPYSANSCYNKPHPNKIYLLSANQENKAVSRSKLMWTTTLLGISSINWGWHLCLLLIKQHLLNYKWIIFQEQIWLLYDVLGPIYQFVCSSTNIERSN